MFVLFWLLPVLEKRKTTGDPLSSFKKKKAKPRIKHHLKQHQENNPKESPSTSAFRVTSRALHHRPLLNRSGSHRANPSVVQLAHARFSPKAFAQEKCQPRAIPRPGKEATTLHPTCWNNKFGFKTYVNYSGVLLLDV